VSGKVANYNYVDKSKPLSILNGKEDVRFLRNNCKLALIFTRITKINVIEVIENFPT
jgi:hypothetical protein